MANKNSKKQKLHIFSLIFRGILTVLLLMLIVFSIKPSHEKVEYNQFLECLDKGIVETAQINSDSGTVTYTIEGSDVEYTTTYPFTDDFIEKLLLAGVDVTPKTFNIMSYVPYLISPIFIILMFIIIYRSQSRSDHNDILVESPNATFKDVAGMDEVKENLMLLAKMMKDDSFKKAGVRVPRGILLEGPPGNGKTLIARAFAGEAGVNFMAINASDMGSPFVGVGSMKIKKIFADAKKAAPCVIFIDEIDAIGARRGERDDSASKEMNSIVTTLLNQLDGFTPTDNITVIAATNRADALDNALVRPGRFDKRIAIDYPDKKTRKELLELYIGKVPTKFNIDIDAWANKLRGYSCSKIESIINEALIIATNRYTGEGENFVTSNDMEEAAIRLDIKGFIKKNKERNSDDTKIIAYHEAGHAIITRFLTTKVVSKVTIAPTTSGAGGFTMSDNKDDEVLIPLAEHKNRMALLYGGRAAEYILGNEQLENVSFGAAQDIVQVTKLASQYAFAQDGFDYSYFGKAGEKISMEKSKEVLNEAWVLSIEIVKKYWKYVEALATALLEKETLNTEEFEAVINSVDEKESVNLNETVSEK